MSSETPITLALEIKAYGLNGWVKVRACYPEIISSPQIKFLSWQKNGLVKKFDLLSCKDLKNGYYTLHIKGITSPELARKEVQGGEFFLNLSELEKLGFDLDSEDNPEICIGYTVVSEQNEIIGQVYEIESGPAHDYLVLKKEPLLNNSPSVSNSRVNTLGQEEPSNNSSAPLPAHLVASENTLPPTGFLTVENAFQPEPTAKPKNDPALPQAHSPHSSKKKSKPQALLRIPFIDTFVIEIDDDKQLIIIDWEPLKALYGS